MARPAPDIMAALAGSRTAMEARPGPATATRRPAHPARPPHPAHPPRAAMWPRPVAHRAAIRGAVALTVSLRGTVAGPAPAARLARPAAVVVARRAEAAAVVGPARPSTRVAPVVGPAAPAESVPAMPRVPASQPHGGRRRRCRWRRLAL